MLNKFSDWVVHKPYLAILISLMLVAGLGYGIKDFKMNNNSRAFFGDGNPDLERLLDLEVKYGARDIVLFIVHPKDNKIKLLIKGADSIIIDRLDKDKYSDELSKRADWFLETASK